MSIGIPAAPLDMSSIKIVVEGERVDLLGIERDRQNLIGKLKLEQLKADLQLAWQDSWSLRRFHELVFSAGRVPVEMLRGFELELREESQS